MFSLRPISSVSSRSPALPLTQSLEKIFADSCSWVKYQSNANSGDGYQFEPLRKQLPEECVFKAFKADQWVLLARPHVTDILELLTQINKDVYFNVYKTIKASDEMFIPTTLSVLGHISQAPSPDTGEVSRRRVTFSDWTDDAVHPRLYRVEDMVGMLRAAREADCLFARKLKLHSAADIDSICAQWTAVVLLAVT